MEQASAKAAMESNAVIGSLDTEVRRICGAKRYRARVPGVLKEIASPARDAVPRALRF
jgi:hypothetical protein